MINRVLGGRGGMAIMEIMKISANFNEEEC